MPGKSGLKATDCLNKPSALSTHCKGLAAVAPAYCCTYHQQTAPYTILLCGVWASRVFSRLLCFPEPGCLQSANPAVFWYQNSIETSSGITICSLQPSCWMG